MIVRPIYFDTEGHVLAPQFYAASQDDGQDALNAISLYSHAGLSVARFTVIQPEDTLVSSGTYQSIYDVAELNFSTASRGSRVRVYVPAPHLSMFQSDTETVNASAISSLISTLEAKLTDPLGNPITAYISGVRRRLPPAR